VGACVKGDVTRIFDAHHFPERFLERDMEEFKRAEPVA